METSAKTAQNVNELFVEIGLSCILIFSFCSNLHIFAAKRLPKGSRAPKEKDTVKPEVEQKGKDDKGCDC
jgi:hypothetical protein